MSFESLPDGWRVWNEEPSGRVILTFRPDQFDGDDLPAACLPTIYLTNGSRRSRPGAGQYATDQWHVVLFLEPEIEAVAETYEGRESAVDAARDVAARFADGDVDYREAYQVPREAYFERLDELVGQ
ncbi:hypothetical protein J2751_000205 [Halorubrum alkaliphilum]|uniref:Uncharacterized protein n=1 Tax=Halorubrum alkaliphilum TaxID=261290 RepID=A0A8T4GD88_9EURY|nr:DUF5820 family protein [Halorubrum alkaliphilum]MBP1921222.1 hypothetical protein [Halorubrum alkaliphilum]